MVYGLWFVNCGWVVIEVEDIEVEIEIEIWAKDRVEVVIKSEVKVTIMYEPRVDWVKDLRAEEKVSKNDEKNWYYYKCDYYEVKNIKLEKKKDKKKKKKGCFKLWKNMKSVKGQREMKLNTGDCRLVYLNTKNGMIISLYDSSSNGGTVLAYTKQCWD